AALARSAKTCGRSRCMRASRPQAALRVKPGRAAAGSPHRSRRAPLLFRCTPAGPPNVTAPHGRLRVSETLVLYTSRRAMGRRGLAPLLMLLAPAVPGHAQTAGGATNSFAIYTQFGRRPSPAVITRMQSELDTVMEPWRLQWDWRTVEQAGAYPPAER